MVTFNQGGQQPKPPVHRVTALDHLQKSVFTERCSLENQDPNRQKEIALIAPKVLATHRSKANPPLIHEKKRSKSPIQRVVREHKEDLVLRSKSVQPVRHAHINGGLDIQYSARDRPKSSQKHYIKQEPRFVIPVY